MVRHRFICWSRAWICFSSFLSRDWLYFIKFGVGALGNMGCFVGESMIHVGFVR